MKCTIFLLAVVSTLGGGYAFAPGSRVLVGRGVTGSSLTSRFAATDVEEDDTSDMTQPPPVETPKALPAGEKSRQFRRTIYTHDDWVRHRGEDRIIRNLKSAQQSGVYRTIATEISITTFIAVFVVAWNAIFGGYTGFDGSTHGPIMEGFTPVLGLPLVPFTTSSPFLALLLVFRTNASYTRWDEARKNWGMNINHTRDLNRMANAWYDPKFKGSVQTFEMSPVPPKQPLVEDMSDEEKEERRAKLQNLSLATWAFVRSMCRHLSPNSDEGPYRDELFEKLPRRKALTIINAAHRPNRALFDLSVAIEDIPMHFTRKDQMHKKLTIFEDNLGSSERLLNSPVPLIYTQHLARFIFIWLALLPFALWAPMGGSWNHTALIPVVLIISLFVFGIEELAIQLEEPFTVLPMQAYSERIGNWCNEMVGWTAGDNNPPYEWTVTSKKGKSVPASSGPNDMQSLEEQWKSANILG